MIRWSYLGPRLAVLAMLWAGGAFALDPLLERALEAGGSAALGARVEVGGLRTRVFPPSLSLSRFAAADPEAPMRNLFEFESASFAFEGRPLLEKKLVVSAASLGGLVLGTERRTSGALPRSAPPPGAAALARWAGEAKASLGAAGSEAKADLAASYTVDPESLSSVRLARELEARWPQTLGSWKGKVSAFGAEARAKELEDLLKKAESAGPAEKLAAAAELAKKAGELRRGVQGLSDGFKAELERAKADLAAAQRAKEEDLAVAAAKLKLPVFDAETLTRYLLGPQAAVWAARAARLAAARRDGGPGAAPAPARRGVDVPFPKERSWPRVWLKRLTLAGTADVGGPLELRGTATDWSTDPALVGEPARLSLAGAQGDRGLSVALTSDHRRADGSDSLEVTASGVGFPAQSLGEGPYAVAVGAGRADVRGRVVLAGGRLGGEAALKALPSSLEASAPGGNPLAVRALSEALKGLRSVELKAAVTGTPEHPELSLSSNLGAAAAGALRAAVGREAEERLKGVRAQIDKAFEEKAGGLRKSIDGQAGELLKGLGAGDARLQAVQDSLGKRLKSPLPIPSGLDRLFK
jgi:uncharacterized protein (TIGR03545 family)